MTTALENMYGLLVSLPEFEGSSYRKPQSLNLMSSSVDITVRGFVAHMSLDLKYLNTFNRTVDVTYTCPVDAKSAIFEFKAELNGRTIHAHCLEKEKAKTIYQKAVSEGHSAVYASEASESADVLILSLGNLYRDEIALLHLEMVMELPVKTDGSVKFTLPIVFNPRYSPNLVAEPDEAIMLSRNSKNPSLYETDVKAKVIGTLKIDRIVSSSSTFNTILNENATEAELREFMVGHQYKDWGFRIYYHSPNKPHVLKETGDRSSTGMMADDVIMLNLFPEIPMDAFSPHNEIIFVVDCSGSMQGDKILRAKTTLLLFLKSLPQGCRFNIICFGSDFKQLFEESGSKRYTEDTMREAVCFQQKIDANLGGTEMYRPLKHIYAQKPTDGYARQILIMTDGQVWNVYQLIDLVARNSVDTRLFSVGIGAGASTALVKGLAQAGKGRYEMINDINQLQITIMGLMASMLQHSVINVQVNIELDPPYNVSLIPSTPPVIFGGQHLILYARAPSQSIVKKIRVTGSVGGKAVCYKVKEEDCKQIDDTKLSLHRIGAKKQIAEWQIRSIGNDQDLIDLSIASGVACRLTAYVGIDQEKKSYIGDFGNRNNLGLSSPLHSQVPGHPAPPLMDRRSTGLKSSRMQQLQQQRAARIAAGGFSAEMQQQKQQQQPCISRIAAGGFPEGMQQQQQLQQPCKAAIAGDGVGSPERTQQRQRRCKQGFSFGGESTPYGLACSSRHAQSSIGMVQPESVLLGLNKHFAPGAGAVIKTCSSFSSSSGGAALFGASKSRRDQSVNSSIRQEDILFEVIMKQNFDGSWNLDVCTTMLKIPVQQMEKLKGIEKEFNLDDLSFSTVVCLAWFRTQHLKRKLEWDFISIKGSMFLQSKGLDSSQLVDKCVALLS